jgi:hypothetical protein
MQKPPVDSFDRGFSEAALEVRECSGSHLVVVVDHQANCAPR